MHHRDTARQRLFVAGAAPVSTLLELGWFSGR
jgi:hypothetical protein